MCLLPVKVYQQMLIKCLIIHRRKYYVGNRICEVCLSPLNFFTYILLFDITYFRVITCMQITDFTHIYLYLSLTIQYVTKTFVSSLMFEMFTAGITIHHQTPL